MRVETIICFFCLHGACDSIASRTARGLYRRYDEQRVDRSLGLVATLRTTERALAGNAVPVLVEYGVAGLAAPVARIKRRRGLFRRGRRRRRSILRGVFGRAVMTTDQHLAVEVPRAYRGVADFRCRNTLEGDRAEVASRVAVVGGRGWRDGGGGCGDGDGGGSGGGDGGGFGRIRSGWRRNLLARATAARFRWIGGILFGRRSLP